MYITQLRKVGGAVMLVVPPAFLDRLHLQAGATVGLTVVRGCLVARQKSRPHYTMAGLLAASDYSQPRSSEDSKWVDAPAVGGELP